MEDKCEKYVFLERSNRLQRTPNFLWCPLIKTHHYIIFFVRPLHSKPGMKCYCWPSTDQYYGRPNVRPCTHEILCPYVLVLIFNVKTISCPILRTLSCLTKFCDHNFSLICRFNLQFSQNYINIDTDEIQH